jgi:hypothetical protein
MADRFGRKPVLVAGRLVGLPVPILIILAPSWSWIVLANLLLGANQGSPGRLASAAGPDEVLVTLEAANAADLEASAHEQRDLTLKGKSDPIRVVVLRAA